MSKIEPRLYQEILAGLQLDNIQLVKISAKLNEEYSDPIMSVNVNERADFTVLNERKVKVFNSYTITIKSEKQEKEALKIKIGYNIFFTSQNEFTKDFFAVYKDLSLPLNIWPFVRECVNSMTARMNIPPLTLPLIKRN